MGKIQQTYSIQKVAQISFIIIVQFYYFISAVLRSKNYARK